VSRYVITVTPDTGSDRDMQNAHTTVRVDTSTGQTRITELTVRAAAGGGLAPADLPVLDLDLLVRALTGRPGPSALPEGRPARKATHRTGRAATATSAKKKATARKAGAQTTRSAAKDSGRRAYRRMPDPEQVVAAYEKVGTITGLANHFDVPRHTATGWARRLRSLGYPIGRG
jgi:hypothetical protein